MSEGVRDKFKVSGWVEIIVRDKDGNIKIHYGDSSPPPEPEEKEKKGEEEHDCPDIGSLFTSLPAKMPEFFWRKNIITDVGFACIIRLIFEGLTETKFGYLAIGTGTASESVSDTALGNEIKRKAAIITQITTTVTGDTAKLEATYSGADGLTGSHNVSEAGIFNASTGGSLLARKVFPAIPLNWDLGDSLTLRYYVQITR
jgi:hypothetical protein